MRSHYPDLHGFVITDRHQHFEEFIKSNNLDRAKYRLMRSEQDTRGHHVDSYPNTMVIFLTQPDDEWFDPVGKRFISEFHHAGLVLSPFFDHLMSIIAYVLRIPDIAYLPKYLTHDEEYVRDAAERRYGELIGTIKMLGNEMTNCNLRLEKH